MAHVQFRTGSSATNGHPVEFIVDGTDLTMAVLAEGFSIDVGDPALGIKPTVKFAVVVDDLDLDLPAAVLDAMGKSREVDLADAR